MLAVSWVSYPDNGNSYHVLMLQLRVASKEPFRNLAVPVPCLSGRLADQANRTNYFLYLYPIFIILWQHLLFAGYDYCTFVTTEPVFHTVEQKKHNGYQEQMFSKSKWLEFNHSYGVTMCLHCLLNSDCGSKCWFHRTFYYLLWLLLNTKLQPLCADQELEHHVLAPEAHGATNETRPEAQ